MEKLLSRLIPFACIIFNIATLCSLQAQTNIVKLNVSFDKPTSLNGRAAWLEGRLYNSSSENKPTSTGDGMKNADEEWESKSLPIGNGSIGANVFGSICAERISFNEKTLWRGGPNTSKGADYYWNVNKESAHFLKDIRQAFTDGNEKKAAEITRKNFNSTVPYESNAEKPFRFGNFTTMGEFYIETGHSEIGMSEYRRTLSLDSALVTINYKKDGVRYLRKYFTSYPDNVMVARFTSDQPSVQNLKFRYEPNPVSSIVSEIDGDNGILFKGKLDNNGMKYAIRIHVLTEDGTAKIENNQIIVNNASDVTFLVTADTDYKLNCNPDFSDSKAYVGVNPFETTKEWIRKAEIMKYDRLLSNHIEDYSSLFNRVNLSINPTKTDKGYKSTPKRLKDYRNGDSDPYLETLYYQYGRYLLIASSRPGNMPANLQGLWHNNVDGPWRVDYHNNINVQMNYWPACSTNLSECELPLFDYIKSLVKPGEKTAKSYFGAKGWTASISGNIFGFTTPLSSEDMSWNFSPMAGPWLATHVWDYYDFTRNKTFLKETGYDLIKSSAIFAVDYLWHKSDGSYTAAPSTSPEHGPIDEGTTFSHAVIREILNDAIDASKVLNCDVNLRKQWQEVLNHLSPYKIGRYGQLMEWSKDIDDPNDEHRHVNHLFGLHPGHSISTINNPELAQACRIVLEHRGDGATGWSMGWKLNQWARLHDGNHAYKLYKNLLKSGTLDNLWDTHAPFQIDGNFGGTAGITEMLLQSHAGFIHLLPALPDEWNQGSVGGLLARGNFIINLSWENNQLIAVDVLSNEGSNCILKYKNSTLTFKTKKNKTYKIKVVNNNLKLAL